LELEGLRQVIESEGYKLAVLDRQDHSQLLRQKVDVTVKRPPGLE
jgi:hypothetical protein